MEPEAVSRSQVSWWKLLIQTKGVSTTMERGKEEEEQIVHLAMWARGEIERGWQCIV